MSLFKSINIQESIIEDTDYVNVDLTFEPVGKGSLESNSSTLVYDSSNLGYVTINNISCPILTNLYNLDVVSYDDDMTITEITSIPKIDDESSYLQLAETKVLRFRILIEKTADIPTTITIGTKELGETTFIVVLKAGVHKPRPYYSGEINTSHSVFPNFIPVETYVPAITQFEILNEGHYNLDISSITFQDQRGETMDYVSFTDETDTIINNTSIAPQETVLIYVNYDATSDRTGIVGGSDKWTDSVASEFNPNYDATFELDTTPPVFQSNITNTVKPSFQIPMYFGPESLSQKSFRTNPMIIIKSNDQSHPEWKITVEDLYLTAPFLTMREGEIKFEDVIEGTENYKEIMITNNGLASDLIIKDISVNHTHSPHPTGEKLITTDHDFTGDNYITIPPGYSNKVTLKFENATYSDDTNTTRLPETEGILHNIRKTLTIESNAINSSMNQYGYGGSSGSYTQKDGTITKQVNIRIVNQVENYYVEKYIRPSFEFNVYQNMETGKQNSVEHDGFALFYKNSTQTNYSNDEIEYSLMFSYKTPQDDDYWQFEPVRYNNNLAPFPKHSAGSTIGDIGFGLHFQGFMTIESNLFNWGLTMQDGTQVTIEMPMLPFGENSWYDKDHWNGLPIKFTSDGSQIETINCIMNVRLKSTKKVIGTYKTDMMITNSLSPRPDPISSFTLSATEGLKNGANQELFKATNTSSGLQWFDQKNKTIDYVGSDSSTVKSYWKLSVDASGNDITTTDCSVWWATLDADEKTKFSAGGYFHIGLSNPANNDAILTKPFFYDDKGNKKIELTVSFDDNSVAGSAVTRTSTVSTQTVSIYEDYNPKMLISPRPYAILSPKFGGANTRTNSYRTEVVIYNNSYYYKQLTVKVVDHGEYEVHINSIGEKIHHQLLDAHSDTTIPIFMTTPSLLTKKTFLKGYDEGKIQISLDADDNYAIINIVGELLS